MCQAKALGVPLRKEKHNLQVTTWMMGYEYFAIAAAVTGMWEYQSTHCHKMVRALVL